MKVVKFKSDYDPNTILTIVRTDDSDVCLRIRGKGEMRIAANGGVIHGEDLVRVMDAFATIMDVLEKYS